MSSEVPEDCSGSAAMPLLRCSSISADPRQLKHGRGPLTDHEARPAESSMSMDTEMYTNGYRDDMELPVNTAAAASLHGI